MNNNDSSHRNSQQPPKASQYKKGQSGNPRGRPKASKTFREECNDQLGREVAAVENGKTVKFSKRRAMVRTQTERALKGNLKAIALLFRLSRLAGRERPEGEFSITGFYPPGI